MRVLMIPHIGETYGHLIRGLSIARELRRLGCDVEFAASPRAKSIMLEAGFETTFYPVRWNWSHNSGELDLLPSQLQNAIGETISDLLTIVRKAVPDFIIGMPGLASLQISTHLSVPHAAIVHGPHLAPLIELGNLTEAESFVVNLARRVCEGPANEAFRFVSAEFGLPEIDYSTFLKSETIFVPQPGISFDHADNIVVSNFARGSFGEDITLDAELLANACYLTFGSGNPCDTARIVRLTRKVFETVIVDGIAQWNESNGVIAAPRIASSSLAGRVGVVVSHGGIGTVGTFAEFGTPQLIVPTETDQANMAVHAARIGIADNVGLDSFLNRASLGRKVPEFSDGKFLEALDKLKHQPSTKWRRSSTGAREIANRVVSALDATIVGESKQRSVVYGKV